MSKDIHEDVVMDFYDWLVQADDEDVDQALERIFNDDCWNEELLLNIEKAKQRFLKTYSCLFDGKTGVWSDSECVELSMRAMERVGVSEELQAKVKMELLQVLKETVSESEKRKCEK